MDMPDIEQEEITKVTVTVAMSLDMPCAQG